MARARGSYPRCHWFESSCRYHTRNGSQIRFHTRKRPGGQAVKTPPFHGGNTGSSPVRVTTFFAVFLQYGGIAQLVERPPHTRKVTDSSSVVSTKKNSHTENVWLFFLFFPFYCLLRSAGHPLQRVRSQIRVLLSPPRKQPHGKRVAVFPFLPFLLLIAFGGPPPPTGQVTDSSSAVPTKKTATRKACGCFSFFILFSRPLPGHKFKFRCCIRKMVLFIPHFSPLWKPR